MGSLIRSGRSGHLEKGANVPQCKPIQVLSLVKALI